VLLLMTILLVLAGVVLLLVGYAQDSLTLIYLSIGCGAIAGVALIVFAHFNRRRAARLAASVPPSSLRTDAQPDGALPPGHAGRDADVAIRVPAAGVGPTAAAAAAHPDSAEVAGVGPAQEGRAPASPITGVDREGSIESGLEGRTESDLEARTESDLEARTESDIGASTGSAMGSGAGAGTGSAVGSGADAGTDPNTGADALAGTESGTEAGTESSTDAGTDAGRPPGAAAGP
jgi:hypothetical protein